MSYFIKLWDGTTENDIWRDDPKAWRIFEFLLILAYKGKPQGTVRTTRYKIESGTGVNNNTVYHALRRLENAKMITTSRTSQKTTISICNWQKFQGSDEPVDEQHVNNKRTTDEHSYKNKDIRSKKVTTNVVTKNPEVEEVITAFKTQVGRMRRERYQAAAASKLLGEYGRERTLAAIVAVVGSKGRPYAPGITNLEDLWDKWPNLESFFRRESGKANKVLEV